MLIDANRHHPLFHHEIICCAEILTFKENLKVALEGETPRIETRLQHAMPDTLMRVDGVSESLQADFQVVRDKVEQSRAEFRNCKLYGFISQGYYFW